MNTIILSDDHVFIEGIKVNITKLHPESLFIVLETAIHNASVDPKKIQLVVADTRHSLFRDKENILKIKELYSGSNHIIYCDNIFSEMFYNFHSQKFSCYFTTPMRLSHFTSAFKAIGKGLIYIHPKISKKISIDMFEKMSRSTLNNAVYTLTSLEKKLLTCIFKEQPTKVISGILGVSIKTVEAHKTIIYKRTNTHTSLGLFKYALENKLISLIDYKVA